VRAQAAASQEKARANSEEVLAAKAATEAAQALAITRKADAQVALQSLETQLRLAKQTEQLAVAMGDEEGARRARILQLEIEIQLVNARVAVMRAEAEGTIAVAQAKLAELQTSGEVNLVKQAELEASIKLAQAKLAEADATGKSTEILTKQLNLLRNGVGAAGDYGKGLQGLAGSQVTLASATNQANAALEKQLALINAKYASPLGNNKYAKPKGGSVTGNTREERLAGQNAVDNTLMFELEAKLRAGTLTEADAAEMQAVIDALDQNDQIDRDVDRMSPGLFSLDGMRDRQKWRAVRQQLATVLNTFGDGSGTGVGGTGSGNQGASKVGDSKAATFRNDIQYEIDSAGGIRNDQTEAAVKKMLDEAIAFDRVARPSAGTSTSHTVTINLGTRSTTINTASANDADALKQFLVGMQDAAGRS